MTTLPYTDLQARKAESRRITDDYMRWMRDRTQSIAPHIPAAADSLFDEPAFRRERMIRQLVQLTTVV